MSALPFSPVTLAELNTRVADAAARLAWYVAACLRDGGDFTPADMATLREYVATLEGWQSAAAIRCAS